MVEVLRASCRDSVAHIGRPTGEERIEFGVRAGTPQGSPIRGTLFAACTVPLIEELSALLGEGAVLFYADDAAILIDDLCVLPAMHRVFANFQVATGLALKAAKCVVIPLRCHDAAPEANMRRYSAEIAKWVPA